MRHLFLEAPFSFPGFDKIVLIIPWVVIQELDRMKAGKLLKHVQHKAIPAVHFINDGLRDPDRQLWGQPIQLAAQKICEYCLVYCWWCWWAVGRPWYRPSLAARIINGRQGSMIILGFQTGLVWVFGFLLGCSSYRICQPDSHIPSTVQECHASGSGWC